MGVTKLVAAAANSRKYGIGRFSIVTSGKRLRPSEISQLCDSVMEVSRKVDIKLCLSAGLLYEADLRALAAAGISRYHCNLEPAPSYFGFLCSTHSQHEKIDTLKAASNAGMEICSGGIIGMGETLDQRIELAFALRKLGVKSVPVNILSPIKGTPLESCTLISDEDILRTIAIFRFILPDAALRFAGGIFTNLTRDHLDYHKTFENYLKAKKAFFDGLPKTAFALTNADDRNGNVMVQNTRARVAAYSLRSLADFQGKVLEDGFEGMLLDINGREVNVQFIGRFNAANLLAVYGAAVLLGEKPEDVLVELSLLRPVAGRFDSMRSPSGYTAIVDYAHTPDALENVLNAIHEVLRGRGQVITVVGAGGNRDKGKRPLMAQEAARQSDRLLITSDNPRFEDPQAIIDDMLAGLTAEDKKKTLSIVDRREAIRTACMLAQPGDVVLVAGKGHEDYQEIKGVKHHFDDREVIRDLFAN